jgi:hypothetical protein
MRRGGHVSYVKIACAIRGLFASSTAPVKKMRARHPRDDRVTTLAALFDPGFAVFCWH